MTPVEVPKLGNTVEECIVGEWRKKKGDPVTAGEIITEIETDKTTFEITAPVSGTLLEVYWPEGSLVPVFTKLCVIGEPGENGADANTAPAESPAPPPVAAPVAIPVAAPSASPVPTFEASPLSPRAKRFSAEHDFAPPPIEGSGPGGRILEADVRNAFAALQSAPQAPISERVSSVREKIARRLRESLESTAQYTLHTSANASRLVALRARFKASAELKGVTIGDLVLFAVIRALLETPAVNAEYIDGRILRHSAVHLGFACDTDRGLLVPVVRDSQKLTIGQLSARVGQLADQAVKGTIAIGDLSGATFTVSNLGGLGIESFTPILNPPQVAILGVGAIQLKAVRKDGGFEFTDSIGLSLTCDHQVIDGAPGARFLKTVIQKIEQLDPL